MIYNLKWCDDNPPLHIFWLEKNLGELYSPILWCSKIYMLPCIQVLFQPIFFLFDYHDTTGPHDNYSRVSLQNCFFFRNLACPDISLYYLVNFTLIKSNILLKNTKNVAWWYATKEQNRIEYRYLLISKLGSFQALQITFSTHNIQYHNTEHLQPVPDLDQEALGFSTNKAPPNQPLSWLKGKLLKECLETTVCYVITCKKGLWQ